MPTKRKPRKPSRNKDFVENNQSETKNISDSAKETLDKAKPVKNNYLRQQLRDTIKQMQKDRAKGSYVCEENANHEY
tara:strand:+ start:795 stop:1025 length:231 start_codon:yes stop_codon:yes gene_type:complete